MSALVVGNGFKVFSVGSMLHDSGFNDVRCKNYCLLKECESRELCKVDIIVLLVKELEKSELQSLCRKAAEYGTPVSFWQ